MGDRLDKGNGWKDPKVMGPIIAGIITSLIAPLTLSLIQIPPASTPPVAPEKVPSKSFQNVQFEDNLSDYIATGFGAKSALLPNYTTNGSQVVKCTKNITVPDIQEAEYSSDGKFLHDTILLGNNPVDPNINWNTKVTVEMANLSKLNRTYTQQNNRIIVENNKFISSNVSKGLVGKTFSGDQAIQYNYTNGSGSLMVVEKKFAS